MALEMDSVTLDYQRVRLLKETICATLKVDESMLDVAIHDDIAWLAKNIVASFTALIHPDDEGLIGEWIAIPETWWDFAKDKHFKAAQKLGALKPAKYRYERRLIRMCPHIATPDNHSKYVEFLTADRLPPVGWRGDD